jgi:GNAT superfamily N-acetyltransferase
MTVTSDPRSVLAERAEAECFYRLEAWADRATRDALGIETLRIAGGVALSVRNDVTKYWSKALGFGFPEPVDRELIDQILTFYRQQRNPNFVLQIAPHWLPADWTEICAEYGLTAGSEWMKLVCPADSFVPSDDTRLRIAAVPVAEATDAASVMLRGWGMPEPGLVDMLASVVGREGFQVFGAWDGDTMVAMAALHLQGETAQFAGASTLPGYRGRGAQSALLSVRAATAREAGCRWLIAETSIPAEGRPNPSLKNAQRLGFQPLYRRRDWRAQ